MDIKPSSEVLKALGTLHADRVAAKPPVSPANESSAARLKRAEAPAKPDMPRPARFYRPGTLLDIFV